MADSKKVPTLQYALFCREVIENPDELTFRGVLGKVVVGRPKDIVLTLGHCFNISVGIAEYS